MKIIWLHSHFLYPTGGTRFIFEVVSRLKKFHNITVIVEKADEKWINEYTKIGLDLFTISNKTSTSILYWLLFPYYLKQEKQKLDKLVLDADLIISSMFPMNWLASRLGKPYIYYCFEPFAFFYDEALLSSLSIFKRFGSRLLKLAYSQLDQIGIGKANSILIINHAVYNWIKKVYKRTNSKITFMGIDTEKYKKIKIQKPDKWAKNLLLLHSTDFTAMKGTSYLLKSMSYIVKDFPDAKLLITQTVNDNNKKKQYELLIQNLQLSQYIEFIGTIPQQKLPYYYSLADIFCFAADPESIGTTASLSVLEAMSCELPIVRSIGCDDEIINGESGYLADPRKPYGYAQAVIKLLENEDLRKKMGQAGRKRVLQLYRWDKVVDVFREEINKLDNQIK